MTQEQTRAAAIEPQQLKTWLHDGGEIALFDVRERGPFADAHLFLAVPLPYSRLELDVPRLAPRRDVRVVLCDETGDDVAPRAAERLRALGYGNVQVLAGGVRGWAASGMELFAGVNVPSKTFGELAELVYETPHVSATELAERVASGEPLVILDGRPLTEFRKMSIPGALCCPNGELAYRIAALVPDEKTTVVINCAGRTRSIIGAQTLINLGLPNPVLALENGTQGWYLNDLTLEHGKERHYGADTGGPALREAAARLAARHGVQTVTAETVRQWSAEPDRSLFLCDVRTPEEFAAGSLPGAQHTPGGQLVQSTDEYVGVRNARLVLFDDDGVRAPTTASWLRQLGHEAYVLENGLRSKLSLAPPSAAAPQAMATIDAAALADGLRAGRMQVIDVRASAAYRHSRIPGAVWSVRPLLRDHADAKRQVVLVADDAHMAALAAGELRQHEPAPLLLRGGLEAWAAAGQPVDDEPLAAQQAQHIDFVFFVHDRHDGNKDAARRYLEWETGLVAQLDERERALFKLPEPMPPSAAEPVLPQT